MNILLTGGAGFIGSHTCVELLNAGFDIITVDNYSNSNRESLKRVRAITGKDIVEYDCDILDKPKLESIFVNHKIEAVIHFAGYKAVGESVEQPLMYYHNNIIGTITLLETMNKYNCKKIVFSSSATVYGLPESVPIKETFPLSATNPYGRTKLMIEDILRDLWISDNEWRISILRYFNPVGAHPSGKIGEDPKGIPNNIMPFITKVAAGELPHLNIFGNDYDTPDGTGKRDYIHVVDLAKGHVKAVEYINSKNGIGAVNLGTGKGYSVLELVSAFEKVLGKKLPYKIASRRSGDVAENYADVSKALSLFGWKAEYDINKMCEDSWNWQVNNPKGYAK